MVSHEGYRALTTAAGFVVRTDLGVLRVTGADRAVWLQGLLTNDVQALQPGQTRYAAYLTPQGRMISDMRVVSLEDAILLDVPSTLAVSLRERLDGLIFAEDVQVTDDSGRLAIIELHGPAAERARRAESSGAAGLLEPIASVRDDQYGIPGFVVHAPRERVPAIAGTLARQGLPEVSLETLDVVRIEAGIPRFLVDMKEDTIPLEAGIEDRAISFTKGCYVGQELIVRVVQRGGGRVARRLVGLSLEDDGGAAAGDRILSGARAVGTVTSLARSPALGRAIALGYVHREFVEPGTSVEVASGARRVHATVTSLPFVRRPVGGQA